MISNQHRAFSPARIFAITTNTLTDLTRQKVFYVVLMFGLLLIGSSVFMARFTFQQEFQILKDISGRLAFIYLQASLLAALTLFVSTCATTTIVTIAVMVFVYFIGHLQATAREYWLDQQSAGWIARTFLAIVALIFPDLQAFNLVDEIVAGVAIPMALFAKTALLGIFYTGIYTLAATFVFYGKEL